MKKILFCCLLIISSFIVFAQSADETAIQKLMQKQAAAWNAGNIEEFMKGYWQNDSLMFIGHGGITYGYKNTLDNYKKNYDNKEKMGTLFFSDVKMKRLAADHYFIVGKWLLKRSVGDIGGYYTLLFRKINGQWFIVCDHTS
jgi:ketosteroid isomerase-like protein